MNTSKAFSHVRHLTAAIQAVHRLKPSLAPVELTQWQKDTQGLMDILENRTHTTSVELWMWVNRGPKGQEDALAIRALTAAAAALGFTATPRKDADSKSGLYKLKLEYEAYADGTPVPLNPPDEGTP